MRRCWRCREEKPLVEFGRDASRAGREGRASRCATCRTAYLAEWRDRNRDKEAAYGRAAYERERAALHAAYGGRCACCGEDEPAFLTLEHKGGIVPPEHREPSGRRMGATATYRKVREEGYPDKYELLCWNCNTARARHGSCPHERRLEAVT